MTLSRFRGERFGISMELVAPFSSTFADCSFCQVVEGAQFHEHIQTTEGVSWLDPEGGGGIYWGGGGLGGSDREVLDVDHCLYETVELLRVSKQLDIEGELSEEPVWEFSIVKVVEVLECRETIRRNRFVNVAGQIQSSCSRRDLLKPVGEALDSPIDVMLGEVQDELVR